MTGHEFALGNLFMNGGVIAEKLSVQPDPSSSVQPDPYSETWRFTRPKGQTLLDFEGQLPESSAVYVMKKLIMKNPSPSQLRPWKILIQGFEVDIHSSTPSLFDTRKVIPQENWGYLAPELRQGDKEPNESSAVYALGRCISFALAETNGTFQKHVLDRCINPDYSKRYTYIELEALLKDYKSSPPIYLSLGQTVAPVGIKGILKLLQWSNNDDKLAIANRLKSRKLHVQSILEPPSPQYHPHSHTGHEKEVHEQTAQEKGVTIEELKEIIEKMSMKLADDKEAYERATEGKDTLNEEMILYIHQLKEIILGRLKRNETVRQILSKLSNELSLTTFISEQDPKEDEIENKYSEFRSRINKERHRDD